VEGIKTIHAKKAVDSAKAVRELAATFRPFEETVQDEVEWFRVNGYV
jgi:dihydroflavonol-4-reductase